ncbi:MAG: 2-oxo acid dehydrogenase subunit E2 [Oscillospiraceae bacterium]|nr:2-oxo acid dehydrogenase subunit E2 [Oscillospiraceae bacterium]
MDIKQYIRGALALPEKDDKIEYFNVKGRISGNVLVNAQRNCPTPAYTYQVDITGFWEEYQKLKSSCDYHLTFNTLLMRLLAEGLKAAPRLNAHLEYNHTSSCGRLIVKDHIDVAMPVFLESGETFPIKVKNIENKSLREIAQQVDDLLERLHNTDMDQVLFDLVAQRMVGFAMRGKLLSTISQIATGYIGKYKVAKVSDLFKKVPRDSHTLQIDELNEATVCLSNWGPLSDNLKGCVTFSPLLYPQVFLMSVGNARDKEYAFKNEAGEVEIGVKKELPISLMFDHRIGGFGDVVPFVKRLDEIFEHPEIIREW